MKIFVGKRNQFETPGGCVEANKNYHEALKREPREEIGFRCEIVSELCMIVSRYNLIKRINVSRFYIAKIIEKEKLHRTDEEKVLINSVVFKIVDAWLAALEKGDNPVDRD